MIDLATAPRWSRFNGTFGDDSDLAVDMARALVDGFQSTYEINAGDGGVTFGTDQGWGYDSINAMVKHWPGGGTGEGGRDAHYNYGKFAVYPGDNFDEHLRPFTEGAFKLDGATGMATAVMPYYTISYDQDPSGANVGNSYSRYIIQNLLRDTYDFEGVICTDWNIVYDVGSPWSFGGMCWGLENNTITERFVVLLENGIDQFGGVNAIENIMLAYNKMVNDSGKTEADRVMGQHAERLLTNIFNTGLFENPYLNVEGTREFVGNSDFMKLGYDTQLKSIVMLKNSGNVIAENGLAGKKIYATDLNPGRNENPAALFQSYFGENYSAGIEGADAAIVVMSAPTAGSGYVSSDFTSGAGNGYFPITLQYGPYTATAAREQSIAANPNVEWKSGQYVGFDVDNRSYKGKTVSNNANINTLDQYNTIAAAAKEAGIPLIVFVKARNPMVWSEIEPSASAMFVGYSVQTQAALDLITGKTEPSALLPSQQPANMDTVELQYEDTPHDMESYVDADGNVYDFAYGLNWGGVISDARTTKYGENNNLPTTRVQEQDANLIFSAGWGRRAQIGRFDEHVAMHASKIGASMSFTFEGNYFSLLSYKSHSQGMIDIYVDGVKTNKAPIDLYQSGIDKSFKQKVGATFVPYGEHEVTVVIVGRNNRSIGNNVYIDAVDIKGQFVVPNALTDDQVIIGGTAPIEIDVLANDSATGTPILNTPPANGSVELIDGVFVFTPTEMSVKDDSFTYKVGNATATVKLVYADSIRFEETFGAVQDGKQGTWQSFSFARYSGGSAIRSSKAGDTVEVTFYGTGIELIGYKSWSRGKAEITLDGIAKTVDTHAMSYDKFYNTSVYNSGALTEGIHTLKVKVTGDRNFLASGSAIDIDAFVVKK